MPFDPTQNVALSEPRAVKIREPENTAATHSVVRGDINVMVDTQIEAKAIIAAWPVIMQKAVDQANEILSELRKANVG